MLSTLKLSIEIMSFSLLQATGDLLVHSLEPDKL